MSDILSLSFGIQRADFIGNAVTAIAYVAIPVSLLSIRVKPLPGVIRNNQLLATGFILSCATGHLVMAIGALLPASGMLSQTLHSYWTVFVTGPISFLAAMTLMQSRNAVSSLIQAAAERDRIANQLNLIASNDKAGQIILKYIETDNAYGFDFEIIYCNQSAVDIAFSLGASKFAIGECLGISMPGHWQAARVDGESRILMNVFKEIYLAGLINQVNLDIEYNQRHWRNQIQVATLANETVLLMSYVERTLEAQLLADKEYLLQHDELTGLWNDRYLKTLTQQGYVPTKAVLYIDLTGFKAANDTLGHQAGDLILIEIAQRFKALEHIIAIRNYGGDEFVLILKPSHPGQEASDLICYGQEVLAQIKQPIFIERQMVFVTASVGIAPCSLQITASICELTPLSDLIQAADLAMYWGKAKDTKKEGWVECWTASLQTTIDEESKIISGLKHTLETHSKDEFKLVYQPIFDVSSQRVCGCEALLRWTSPDLGQVSPGRFVPIAERSDLIYKIFDWVAEEAISQASKWVQLDPNFYVSINASFRNIEQPGLPEMLFGLCQKYKVEPRNIGLEVTETGEVISVYRFMSAMSQLRDFQFSLLLDDLGQGGDRALAQVVSGLFSTLKLDRSLMPVAAEQTSAPDPKLAMLRAMVQITQDLNMQLIAEGVETEAQANLLSQCQVPYAQGYYFSRPTTAAAITTLLQP